MLAKKRQQIITQIIQTQGYADIKYLSEKLDTSEKTIRLDLNELQESGILKRIHGGAEAVKDVNVYRPLSNESEMEEKEAIAFKALELIKENDVIFIDDGSTNIALARLLGDFPITVLTTDLEIANVLVKKPQINLHIVGGRVRRTAVTYFTAGDEGIKYLSSYHVNKCFLGCSALNVEKGIMIFYGGNSGFKRAVLDISDQKILLVDSTKFNKSAFYVFADLSEMDYLITDSNTPKSTIKDIKTKVENVIIADKW